MVPCIMRWSSGTYNDKPMPTTVDPQLVAAVAKHPSAYFGTKGMAVSGWWMNDVRLFPESFMQQVGRPKTVLPRSKEGTRAISSMPSAPAAAPRPTSITPPG